MGEDGNKQGEASGAAELRLRMAACLSVVELRELGESLAAGPLTALDASGAAAALVRHFEKQGDLSALVAALREQKPLVEWPEIEDVAIEEPEVLAPAGEATIADAVLPNEGDPAAESLPEGAEEEEEAKPPPSAWIPPGHKAQGDEDEKKAERRGLDPRILVAVSALSLVAAIVAYAAGRAGTAEAPQAKSAIASEAELAARAKRPSSRAVAQFERALLRVARACEVDVAGAATTKILVMASDWCGPPPPDVRTMQGALPSDPRPAETAPLPDDLPREPPPPPRPRGGPGTGAPLTSGCIRTCDATHGGCKAGCGAEPTEGSLYAGYQSCLGKCLKEASGCRLACDP